VESSAINGVSNKSQKSNDYLYKYIAYTGVNNHGTYSIQRNEHFEAETGIGDFLGLFHSSLAKGQEKCNRRSYAYHNPEYKPGNLRFGSRKDRSVYLIKLNKALKFLVD
jgi:hypothetical protein